MAGIASVIWEEETTETFSIKMMSYVAVCDARKGAMNQAKDKTDAKYGNKDCKTYADYRDILSRDDIDAVHIATPDHWHAQMIIEGCRHGKDVFCQANLSLLVKVH